MQMQRDGNGESELPSCSDAGQALALTKILKEEFEPVAVNNLQRLVKPLFVTIMQQALEPVAERLVKTMVITNMHQALELVAEDLFSRVVVKEGVQSLVEKLLAGGTRNELLEERSLQLKFLDEVCGPVQTSMELKGINEECLKLALVDAAGKTVNSGSLSSARVEIVLLDAGGNDDENMTLENFERKIISVGDRKKPHFSKSVYINLEKGVGKLIDLKLAQHQKWSKLCNCRLGATIAQNFRGIIVQEAWTAPFQVIDKRSKQYEKHHPPTLSSEVWRLEKIGRSGESCKRLQGENIMTLRDFLFHFYINPEGLKKLLSVADSKWKAILAHAETCVIDDKKMFSHKSSTEPQMRVIYDAVGKLKGFINESHFVPIDNLSADEKDHARKLLSSVLGMPAFGERYDTSFNTEASLVQEFPYRLADIDASTNSSLQQCSNGSGLILCENISGYQTREQVSSSQNIDPSNFYDSGPSGSLGSKEMEELCNPASGLFSDPIIDDGGTPTDLGTLDQRITTSSYFPYNIYNEKHETPSLSDNICKDGEIHKYLRESKTNSDAQELLYFYDMEPFNDMNHLHQHLAGGTSEMVGESSSRLSNASFHSVSSTTENWGFDDDCNDFLGMNEYGHGPPMLCYVDDTYSYNTQICGPRNESCGDEGSGAAASAEPRVVHPRKRWREVSRLFSSLIRGSRSNKKRRVGS